MRANCSEATPYFFAIVGSMFLLGPEPLLPVDGRQSWIESRKEETFCYTLRPNSISIMLKIPLLCTILHIKSLLYKKGNFATASIRSSCNYQNSIYLCHLTILPLCIYIMTHIWYSYDTYSIVSGNLHFITSHLQNRNIIIPLPHKYTIEIDALIFVTFLDAEQLFPKLLSPRSSLHPTSKSPVSPSPKYFNPSFRCFVQAAN